ncbi:MAG: CYTH domain-containing protein, partial [Planctomycetes bacterium]|nr:CYTH domain-containing protein [Planctomycetota bacterium]
MAVETEAKFRVESHDPIRQRLRAAGARSLGTVLETNLILDRPDGSLRRQGCGLRLRTSQPLEGETARTTLTFKG